MKRFLFVLAWRNFRDVEFFAPKEILEKAGIELKIASNKKGLALGADGGEVKIDFLLSEILVDDFDGVAFVGGPGCLKNLDNQESYRLIQEFFSKGKIVSAICIAPVILAKAGILKGKKATVWSSPLDKTGIEILEKAGAEYLNESVVVDGKIVTANGPQAAQEFGKTLIDLL
jgi:protease I